MRTDRRRPARAPPGTEKDPGPRGPGEQGLPIGKRYAQMPTKLVSPNAQVLNEGPFSRPDSALRGVRPACVSPATSRPVVLPLGRWRLRLSRPRRSLGNCGHGKLWLHGWLVEIER